MGSEYPHMQATLVRSAAPVVAKAPVADVVAQVRSGKKVHRHDAVEYCAKLTKDQAAAKRYGGCKIIRCAGGSPCGWALGFGCGDCLWFPLVGVLCLPCPILLFCACEREANQWLLRDKGRVKSAFVIVDEERATLVNYSVPCCTEELCDDPYFYCEKMC